MSVVVVVVKVVGKIVAKVVKVVVVVVVAATVQTAANSVELPNWLWALTSFLEVPNRPLSSHKKWSFPAPCAPRALLSELPGPNSRPTTYCPRQSCSWEAVGFPLTAGWRVYRQRRKCGRHNCLCTLKIILPCESDLSNQLAAALVAQQPVSYRGQQLTPVQVRRSGNCPPRHSGRSSDRPPRQRAGLANRDLRVLSWNAGHLGQQQWAEIKSWLQTEAKQVCDIFVLQETHWQASAEFSVAGWYCISSASEYVPTEEDNTPGGTAQSAPTFPARAWPNKPRPKRRSLRGSKGPSTTKADGVMVLLSPEIPTNTVRWKEHVKERLLEPRFDWHGARTTALAVYQHVWSPAKTVQANKQDRAAVLKSLARSVKRVPARDTLVIAGDFNSSVSPTPRLVGPRTLTPQEARPDEAELTNFVRTHHLAVLNTWQVSSPHTFVQGDSRTQIDFLLTKVSSWSSAKQAAPIADFPLGSWKTGGHLPLLAKIKPVRHWQLPGPRIKPLKHDSEALQQAVRQGLPIVMDMQKWVRDNMRQGMTPPEWDTLLSKATQHFFPKLPTPPQADSADTVLARRMWWARRMSAHHSLAENQDTAALILQHQKAVRQAKKTKADAFLAEVDAAINAGDQFVAYKVLKKLRPWQPSQKAQLKDSKGYLLSPMGELQELRKYATDVFGKYPRLQDNFVELPSLATTTTTLAKHIASIKPGKAVPKGAAPAAAWKICAQPVAEALAHYCCSLPPEATLEDGLLSADLCLIPKPGKPADKPAQLRPLGILRPDAKGLAGAAREMLAPHVIPFMKPLPQFAYLPGRGLSDAQSRVVQHLREVRQIGRSAKPSREDRKRGLGPPSLVGGITFLLTCLRPLTLLRARIYLTSCRPSPLSPAWSRWSMVSITPQSIAFMHKAATRRWKRPQASNRDANSRLPCFLS